MTNKLRIYWIHGTRYRDDFPAWNISLPRGGWVVLTPSNKCYIIDCAVGTGDHLYKPFLDYLGVKEVEAIFITHFHWDHFNGIAKLLETGMPVKQVYSNGVYGIRPIDQVQQEEMLEAVEKYNVPYSYLVRGDVIEDADIDINILSPRPDIVSQPQTAADYDEGHSGNAMIITMSYGDFTFMCNNDMNSSALRYVYNQHSDFKVTFMQFPHHGDTSGSYRSEALLDVINRAEVDIVFCESYLNMESSINFLADRGINYIDGREKGRFGIEVESDGSYEIVDIPQKISKGRVSLLG